MDLQLSQLVEEGVAEAEAAVHPMWHLAWMGVGVEASTPNGRWGGVKANGERWSILGGANQKSRDKRVWRRWLLSHQSLADGTVRMHMRTPIRVVCFVRVCTVCASWVSLAVHLIRYRNFGDV